MSEFALGDRIFASDAATRRHARTVRSTVEVDWSSTAAGRRDTSSFAGAQRATGDGKARTAARAATRLLDRIAADPALIAQMLNRQLDPAVLALASELGIAVFPTRWQDLDLRCSCPDWAVPCKHLAAAIYLGMSRWVGETTADPRLLTADG